jgi:CNH domain
MNQRTSLLHVFFLLTRFRYSDPIQIRWEGTPQEVILYHSYVIGFDPNFIEIRNSETVSLYIYKAGKNECSAYIKLSHVINFI